MGWELPVATLYRRLASFARLIIFDKRGTGLSDRDCGIASLEERIDDVRAVMAAADSQKAAIVGFSEGSAMALMFAASHPNANQEARLAEREETDNRRKALSDALTVLNERERRIFEARRLADEPMTLEELADELRVSRERVRQIEMRAFEKLQKAVRAVSPPWKSRRSAALPNKVPFCPAATTHGD